MRTSNYKALLLGLVGVTVSGLAGDGCSATKPTEIVPGALTQVQVPLDLAAIKLVVLANGAQKFCKGYSVTNGIVELPSTLGVIGGSSSTTVSIALYGYDNAGANSPDVNQCFGSLPVDAPANVAGTQGPAARVLREAVLTYVDQQTLFLPMPLSFACYDVDCSSQPGTTCIAGQCGSSNINPATLAPFTPSLVDGTGDCFDPTKCFSEGATTAAAVVDPVKCVYEVPSVGGAQLPTTSAGGLNVRIAYTDVKWGPDPGTGVIGPLPGIPLETEILSQDPNEGFTVDPSKPTQFTLAPNLCTLVHQTTATSAPTNAPGVYHTISNVEVAVTPDCPSKVPLLPFCSGEQQGNVSAEPVACGIPITLDPTPSALYLVMDDSGSMYGAFNKSGYATTMSLSFASPVFRRTYVAFRFLSHQGCNAAGSSTYTNGSTYTTLTPPNAYPFTLAPGAQPEVATALLNWAAPDTFNNPKPLDLLAAMDPTTGVYAYLNQFQERFTTASGSTSPFNTAAVVFFVNRTAVSSSSTGTGDAGGDDGGGGEDAGADYPTTGLDCPLAPGQTDIVSALGAESQQASALGLQTYFIVLDDKSNTPQTNFYTQVQAAGAGVTALGASTSQDLTQVVNTLASVASCVYDAPTGVDATATLKVTIPPNNAINPSPTAVDLNVPPDSTCSATTVDAGPVGGWSLDAKLHRIRICGTPCEEIRGAIAATVGAALLPTGDGGVDAGESLPTFDGGAVTIADVPVTVTMTCPPDASLP